MPAFPQHLKAVIFDFDGTIADTEIHYGAYLDRVMRSYGIELTDEEKLQFVGGDDKLIVPPIFERWGVDKTLEDYFADIECSDNIYQVDPLEPLPGFAGFARGLRARGILLGLASSTSAYNILAALNRMGLTGLFDVIVCRDMVKVLKPNPEPYEKALGFLGVDARDCVAFEDSPSGITAAHAAGIYTVGFTGASIPQDVSMADDVVASWAEASDGL